MTWLTKLLRPDRKAPAPPPAPQLYAVHSPQRGYFAPGGEVWSDENRELAQAQRDVCELNMGNYDWRVVTLGKWRRGAGPSEVKR